MDCLNIDGSGSATFTKKRILIVNFADSGVSADYTDDVSVVNDDYDDDDSYDDNDTNGPSPSGHPPEKTTTTRTTQTVTTFTTTTKYTTKRSDSGQDDNWYNFFDDDDGVVDTATTTTTATTFKVTAATKTTTTTTTHEPIANLGTTTADPFAKTTTTTTTRMTTIATIATIATTFTTTAAPNNGDDDWDDDGDGDGAESTIMTQETSPTASATATTTVTMVQLQLPPTTATTTTVAQGTTIAVGVQAAAGTTTVTPPTATTGVSGNNASLRNDNSSGTVVGNDGTNAIDGAARSGLATSATVIITVCSLLFVAGAIVGWWHFHSQPSATNGLALDAARTVSLATLNTTKRVHDILYGTNTSNTEKRSQLIFAWLPCQRDGNISSAAHPLTVAACYEPPPPVSP